MISNRYMLVVSLFLWIIHLLVGYSEVDFRYDMDLVEGTCIVCNTVTGPTESQWLKWYSLIGPFSLVRLQIACFSSPSPTIFTSI